MPAEPPLEPTRAREYQPPAEDEPEPPEAGRGASAGSAGTASTASTADSTSSVRPVTSAVERNRRQRYLAEIFGEVLPSTTGDESEQPSAQARDGSDWYRENRPPHHG